MRKICHTVIAGAINRAKNNGNDPKIGSVKIFFPAI